MAIVDESGASYYSISELAMVECPQLSVEFRGAVSILNRVIDPLSEYTKIEPHHLSVGMYQHDIKPKKLSKFLEDIVSECIADVGVNVNTASESILRFVPGLNRRSAKEIVHYRRKSPLQNRNDLMNIYGIGHVTFDHCAGFLKVETPNSIPLDSTPVHPDDYVIANEVARRHPELNKYYSSSIPPVTEVISQEDETRIMHLLTLSDPRSSMDPIEIRPAKAWVNDTLISGIQVGMVMDGIVRNITSFGAFIQLVDSGICKDGLLHISEYPIGVYDVHYYKLNQRVPVRILDIEKPRGDDHKSDWRIKLTCRI
jgi:uncharacterized protein